MVVGEDVGGLPGGLEGRVGGRAVVPDSGDDRGFDPFVCLDQQEIGWEIFSPRTGNYQRDGKKAQSEHKSRAAE